MFVFVYGTLKRGGALHSHLAGQRLLGEAQTATRCRLHRLGWYPGLVDDADGVFVSGELWEVDEPTLQVLDEIEGVDEGLYERRPVQLQAPFNRKNVLTYYYLGDITDCPDCGTSWDSRS